MMDLSSRNCAHSYITVKPPGSISKVEAMDYSVPVLDLCVRRKSRTPSPKRKDVEKTEIENPTVYQDAPTSTVSISSPGSHSHASSETSENSISSDPYHDFNLKLTPQAALLTKVKVPRPFKAYPKNPLTLSTGITAECVLGKGSVEAYSEFRKQMLSQVQATHGITNKNMRRTSQTGLNNNSRCDPTYWEKRRKNNEAAKRSRDARRAKEDELAIRAAFLEQENIKLRYEVAAVRSENDKLKSILYGHTIV